MKSLADRLPVTTAPRPNRFTRAFDDWNLNVDPPRSSMRSAPALRLIVTTAASLIVGGSTNVFACPVCFGAAESSMIDGAKLGVLVMLAVLFAVQGAFVAFFLYLRKRAKRIADIELDTEWSELQGGAPRT